ncbi:hypothetical protein GCM10027591_03230 [Zhihengliuella somnathii]
MSTTPTPPPTSSTDKPDLAPAEGGLPGAVPTGGHSVLSVEEDFAGNGYTAAQTDSGDSETSVDSCPDLGSNVALHARPSLGGRASVSETAAPAPISVASVDFAELDVPGADPGDEVEPFVVGSTPAQVAEAKAFFATAKKAETPEQVKRARMQSRVFSIMQYREHPETGEVMLTQEQIDEGLEALVDRLHRWAYVWHPYDRLVEVDEGTGETVCCGIKGLHVHMVLWVKEDPRPTIRTVSDAFSIPSARVKPPKEMVEEGGTEHNGRDAAEKAFFDLVEYLPHESRGKNAIRGIHQPDRHYLVDKTQVGMPGKYQYGRGRIVANFDFGRELDAHMGMRRNAAEGGGGAKLSKLFQAVGMGSLTLKQVRDQEPAIYFAKGNLAHFQKLRGDYLAYQDAPESVMNFYIFGLAGVGKDMLAKALARALARDEDKPYFKVGGENVSWEGYDGEPVIIWEDMRVGDMIRTAKSRGMLFRILGPWREPDEKPIVNIKGSKTQLLNRVNIVTGPEDYEEFLRGLAGEYTQLLGNGQRVQHKAENLGQGFRRFPVIIPVAEREFSIFVNSGVLNGTREYQSYERYEHMRQDLELLARRCKAIQDTAERERVRGEIEARTVAPIVEQHDRIAQPDMEPIDAEDLFAEFADVGQPIPQSSVEVAVTPSEPSPRDRCICEEWQGYALDHTESCPIRTDAEAAMAEMRQREAEREAAAEAHRQAELERKVARLRANNGLLVVGGVR